MKEDEIANLICSAQLEMIYFLWVFFFPVKSHVLWVVGVM